MTTRKKQTRVKKKRARGRPARRAAAARQRRDDGSLILAAACTVAEADTLKTELAGRLQESEPVTVDVSAVQRIDTAGLQLLAAFVRDRRTAGRAVAWRGRASALETAAALLGLHDMLELQGEAGR
jgi:ABC-type transporter Mla MlaB component